MSMYYVFKNIEQQNLELEKQEELIKYLKENLFSIVFLSQIRGDFDKFVEFLSLLNYDKAYVSKFLDIAYQLRNIPNQKNNTQSEKIWMKNLIATYDLFNKLDLDPFKFEDGLNYNNDILSRVLYSIYSSKDELSGGISIVDFAKEVLSRDKEYDGDIEKACYVFKVVNMIERGVGLLNNAVDSMYDSKEIIELFSVKKDLREFPLSYILRDYYPEFSNSLFAIIKAALENDKLNISTGEDLVKYLQNYKLEKKKSINKVINKVKNIEIDTSKKIEEIFTKLIDDINNVDMDAELKISILDHINVIYGSYSGSEYAYVDAELDYFFKNLQYYVNDIVVSSNDNKDGMDELSASIVGNCKDFFIEIDTKRFKEIVDYLLNKTLITMDDLSSHKDELIGIFKTSDAQKLNSINEALKDFKEFINNSRIEGQSSVNVELFETIIMNDPSLFTKGDKDLKEVISFLKGDLSLINYGYNRDFRLEADFLSYEFLSKLAMENYKDLFNCSIEKIINNLHCIEGKCANLNIDFETLNINEDLIELLFKDELQGDLENSIVLFNNIFTKEDLKNIIENNPKVLTINQREINLIMQRCFLNENSECNFYKLLASELYAFDHSLYEGVSDEVIIDREFEYINFNLKGTYEYDYEELLTSNVVSDDVLTKVVLNHQIRNNEIEKLEKSMKLLESGELSFEEFVLNANTVIDYFNLLYKKVPYIQLKERLVDIVVSEFENYKYKVDDYTSDKEIFVKALQGIEKKSKETQYLKENLENILKSKKINSSDIIEELKDFINKLDSKIIKENERAKNEALSSVGNSQKLIEDLNSKLEQFETVVYKAKQLNTEFDFDKSKQYKKSFKLVEEFICEEELTTSKLIKNETETKTILLFEDDIDVSNYELQYMKDVNKFIGDSPESIRNRQFMVNIEKNKDDSKIEKYLYIRKGIYSRRKDNTPVRVYYIPISNNKFKCYYIIAIEYKKHDHSKAGCSSNDVYAARLAKAKKIAETIKNLNDEEEVLEFINEANKKYEEIIAPVIDAIEKSKNNQSL